MDRDPSSHDQIRRLNDAFRTTLTGGHILLTQVVQALDPACLARLLVRLRQHDGFDADSDPHGEHDFGTIDEAGERYFWKIDYYDLSMLVRSKNPANRDVTIRVLTLMRADEY